MKIPRTLSVAVFALFLSAQVRAVMLSPGDEGQVLIFPYVGTLGGNTSAITISSPGLANKPNRAKALKVHFRDRHGQVVLSFNLYLAANSTWTAALTRVDGDVYLKVHDSSCTAPNLTGAGDSVAIAMDSGFLEVIEMGEITDYEIEDAVNARDCDTVRSMWSQGGKWRLNPSYGLSPPTGALRGTVSLINVNQGTLYSFVARALKDFSDIQQHTPPEETLPDLSSAHDAGTDTAQTTSVLCHDGACQEDTWARPLDAVAVAMQGDQLLGEYSINNALGARSEVILTFPLRSYYEAADDTWRGDPMMEAYFLDRSGAGELGQGFGCIVMDYQFCRGTWVGFANLQSVIVLSVGASSVETNSAKSSTILGENFTAFSPDDKYPTLPDEGSFWIGVEMPRGIGLESNSGQFYSGSAALGVVLQRFSNGQLENDTGQQILSNYGNAFELSRR